ncbi:hypothetical protein [Microbacterium laevaniformans]|uniref:hypothetical protein n=1 Tax=Microbacterium laevaniformans TaxID=36807 RepID=UPI003D98AD69
MATLLALTLLVTGCASDGVGAESSSSAPTSPVIKSVEPQADAGVSFETARRLGYAVYRVPDAELLGRALGMPTGASIVEPGASRELIDGMVVGLVDDDYGVTLRMVVLDESTGAPAEPSAEFVFYGSVEELEGAGLIEHVNP